jgi:ketosteroid isomerase-like protein
MSANLDLVRSIYAAGERGDFRSTDWVHPEIEFVIADGPEPGTRIGIAAMAKYWREWLNAWEDYRIEAEEYRELDDQRVLVVSRYSGRGRTSGLEVGQAWSKTATVFYVRDGKVIKLVGYHNGERALADLGLAPEGDPR